MNTNTTIINPTNTTIRQDEGVTVFKVGNYGSLLKSQLVVLRKKDRRGITPASIRGLIELPFGMTIAGSDKWAMMPTSRKWEEAYVRLAIASQATGLPISALLEGLRKAHKVVLGTTINSMGKMVFIVGNSSIGVLNEKLQRGFCSAQPPKPSPFGEVVGNYAVSRKDICLTPMDVLLKQAETSRVLSFEKPNKLAARLIKLGTEKQEDSVYIGKRDLFLVSNDLQGQDLPDGIIRMLSLGTIWVSREEFRKMGHIRTIPVKGVTAPLPASIGQLSMNEWIVGPNSWKSKINGILFTNLGMSHVEISKMTEEEARSMLRPFLTTVTIGGYTVNAYKISVDCYGTNFFSLYGLDGVEDEDSEEEMTPSAIKAKKRGIYGQLLANVSEFGLTGNVFDLNAEVRSLIDNKTLGRKPRTVSITSAEIQQVEISHGPEVVREYIESMMTRGNIKSKAFLFENTSSMKHVTGSKVLEWGYKYFKGEAHTIAVPFSFGDFINALMDRLDGKGFVVDHNGYEFIIPSIPKLYPTDDCLVDDVPFGLAILVKLLASLRNTNTQWLRKHCAHTLEINSYYGNKIQEMKVPGAYLPAVSGFWLKDHEVTSFGDPWGKVTAAKLPILFDQAVTALKNTDKHIPYSNDELDDYRDSFQYSCFVSQEFFTEQQNDGDGDLIKITKRVPAIPYWGGQVAFSRKQVEEYVSGELELRLKLARYSEMPLTALGEGSLTALKAKEDVAKMAANSYKVKALMSRYIRSGSTNKKLIEMASVIAEASAYIVQNESMRAVKHDGIKDMYELVKCQNPESELFAGYESFRRAWSKIIKDYFGIDYSHDDVTFIRLVDDMLSQKFGGLGINGYGAKKLADHLSAKEGINVIFSLMQKGHIRTLKAASQKWFSDGALKVLSCALTKPHLNFAFSGKVSDVIDDCKATDCFTHFMKRLKEEYFAMTYEAAKQQDDTYDYEVIVPAEWRVSSPEELTTSEIRSLRNETRDASRLF